LDAQVEEVAVIAFSWKRVLLTVAALIAAASALYFTIPVARMMWSRNTNVSDNAAYPDLRLPRGRQMVVTDESFGVWAAWCGTDGTIKVRRVADETWKPELYQRLLIHEYGHALLDDLVADGRYWSLPRVWRYRNISSLTQDDESPSLVPPGLRPLFTSYKTAPADIYASEHWRGLMATHFTDSFGEYFAESFARWRMGDEIDPAVSAALAQLTN